MSHAARLGFAELFLGTDIPASYTRLGAERYQPVRGELCIMRVRLAGHDHRCEGSALEHDRAVRATRRAGKATMMAPASASRLREPR